MFAAEALTLALCIATFIVAILNFRNFGKGLKEQCKWARVLWIGQPQALTASFPTSG